MDDAACDAPHRFRAYFVMTGDYGLSIFCEDIREEVSGQKTIIGAHEGNLSVAGTFPQLIPKFAVYVTIIEDSETVEAPLNVKIFVPGDRGDEVVVDYDFPIDRSLSAEDPSDGECLYNYFTVRISPLLIKKEGRIKVRAYKHEKEIKLGTILITSAPSVKGNLT